MLLGVRPMSWWLAQHAAQGLAGHARATQLTRQQRMHTCGPRRSNAAAQAASRPVGVAGRKLHARR